MVMTAPGSGLPVALSVFFTSSSPDLNGTMTVRGLAAALALGDGDVLVRYALVQAAAGVRLAQPVDARLEAVEDQGAVGAGGALGDDAAAAGLGELEIGTGQAIAVRVLLVDGHTPGAAVTLMAAPARGGGVAGQQHPLRPALAGVKDLQIGAGQVRGGGAGGGRALERP